MWLMCHIKEKSNSEIGFLGFMVGRDDNDEVIT